MKVLGIRVEPTKTRYALVESDGANFTLLNADGESRLLYPENLVKPVVKPDELVYWLYRELERIFHENAGIEKVCVKSNEYSTRKKDNSTNRLTNYLEGTVLLYCRKHQFPVSQKQYGSLRTRRTSVEADARNYVGRTTRYWTTSMADAVIVAWAGAQN